MANSDDLSFLPDQPVTAQALPKEKVDLSFLPDKPADLSFLPNRPTDLAFLPDRGQVTPPLLTREDVKRFGYNIIEAASQSAPALQTLKTLMVQMPEAVSKHIKVDDYMANTPPAIIKRYHDAKIPDQVAEFTGYAGLGAIEGTTFNMPGLVANVVGRQLAEDPKLPGQIGFQMGSLAGFIAGPSRWLTRAYGTFQKVHPQSIVGVVANRIAKDAFILGTYDFTSEWGGKNIMDLMKNKTMAGLKGAGLGALMGAVGMASSTKYPKMAAPLFCLRLGINAGLMGTYGAIEEKQTPDAIYRLGMAIAFSLGAESPYTSRERNVAKNNWNRMWEDSLKKRLKLESLDVPELDKKIREFGDLRRVPVDLQLAYVKKLVPFYEFNTSTEGTLPMIFEQALRSHSEQVSKEVHAKTKGKLPTAKENPSFRLYEDMKFVSELQKELEDRMGIEINKNIELGPGETHATTHNIKYRQEQVTIPAEKARTLKGRVTGPKEALARTFVWYEVPDPVDPNKNRIVPPDTPGAEQVVGTARPAYAKKAFFAEYRGIDKSGKNIYHMVPNPAYHWVKRGEPILAETWMGDVQMEVQRERTGRLVHLSRGTTREGAPRILGEKFYFMEGNTIRMDYTHVDEGMRRPPARIQQKYTEGAGFMQKMWRATIQDAHKRNPNVNKIEGVADHPGATVLIRDFGAEFLHPLPQEGVLTAEQAKRLIAQGHRIKFRIDLMSSDFNTSKAAEDIFGWLPREFAEAENKARHELATDMDWDSLQQLARTRNELVPSSKNKQGEKVENWSKFNELLTTVYGFADVDAMRKNITKEQVNLARKLILSLKPVDGTIQIPKSKALVPIETIRRYYDIKPDPEKPADPRYPYSGGYLSKEFDTMFMDSLQTTRTSIPEIWKLYRDQDIWFRAWWDQKLEFTKKLKGQIRRLSFENENLDKYAAGELQYADLTPKEKMLADQIQGYVSDLFRELAAKVPEISNITLPHYKVLADRWLMRRLGDESLSYEKWAASSEASPLAEKTAQRTGYRPLEHNAVKTLERMTYAVGKYLAFHDAEAASKAIASLYPPYRRDIAYTLIDFMHGRPTKNDTQVRQGIEMARNKTADILEHVGLKPAADRLRAWEISPKPVSGLSGTIARAYYIRYLGFALDSAVKNMTQWEHAAAIHGWHNTSKAIFNIANKDPEAMRILAKMNLQHEGMERGRGFSEEVYELKRDSMMASVEDKAFGMFNWADKMTRQISALAAYYDATAPNSIKRPVPLGEAEAIEFAKKSVIETQYGYTRADSLVVDMKSQLSRFILFKKWPLAKVEMLRGWIKNGNIEAVRMLAWQEFLMYESAKLLGIDLGPMINSVWQLASRVTNPLDITPAVNEGLQVVNFISGAISGDTEKRDKALAYFAKQFNAAGIRYFGKIENYFQLMTNDWEQRDILTDELIRKVSPKEATINLVIDPRERREYWDNEKRKFALNSQIDNYNARIQRAIIRGEVDKGLELLRERDEKFKDEMLYTYGKVLGPPTIEELRNRILLDNTPKDVKSRRNLPGKSIKGFEEGDWPYTRKKSLWEVLK